MPFHRGACAVSSGRRGLVRSQEPRGGRGGRGGVLASRGRPASPPSTAEELRAKGRSAEGTLAPAAMPCVGVRGQPHGIFSWHLAQSSPAAPCLSPWRDYTLPPRGGPTAALQGPGTVPGTEQALNNNPLSEWPREWKIGICCILAQQPPPPPSVLHFSSFCSPKNSFEIKV